MGKLSQRRRPGQIFRNVSALVSDDKSLPEVMAQGYALPQMIEDLRKYQAELEIQNKALRFSQRAAEGASERFLTLFSSVPLALMVIDEEGLVLESNAMALRLFRPRPSLPHRSHPLPRLCCLRWDGRSFLHPRGSTICAAGLVICRFR